MSLTTAQRKQKQEVLQRIMDLTAPGKMSPEDAIEFYEELSCDLDANIDALKEENDL